MTSLDDDEKKILEAITRVRNMLKEIEIVSTTIGTIDTGMLNTGILQEIERVRDATEIVLGDMAIRRDVIQAKLWRMTKEEMATQ